MTKAMTRAHGLPWLQGSGGSELAHGLKRGEYRRHQRGRRAEILIVDDDFAAAEVLFEILTNGGFEVQIARDGQVALEALREMKTLPSLILLDLVMPVMNRWQFRRAQLQDPRLASIPVIVLSGSASLESDVSELRPAGFLRKPVAVKRLDDLISRCCP